MDKTLKHQSQSDNSNESYLIDVEILSVHISKVYSSSWVEQITCRNWNMEKQT